MTGLTEALRYAYLIGWLSTDRAEALALAEALERVTSPPCTAHDVAADLRAAVKRRAAKTTERLVA
jgi:hypothetical protein